jgi:glycine/D-amino acid oxidase-like deaminating enzyme
MHPTESPARVGVFKRLQVAFRLLFGVRRHDFRAARTLMKTLFSETPAPWRYLRFAGWTVRFMFVTAPQALAGVRYLSKPDHRPFWLTAKNPLLGHPWSGEPATALPAQVDTLVIGAGMTGGSLAYHWSKVAPTDRVLAVVEMDEASSGASGRNGGSLVMGRFFAMVHGLLVDHWQKERRHGDAAARDRLARKFAAAYCAAAYRNAEMIAETVKAEGFDCDYTRNGWIQLRDASQQATLDQSLQLTQQEGFLDWTRITPERIRELAGGRVTTDAGFSTRAGQYHPAKWVWSLFTRALQSANVQLFTRTEVQQVRRDRDGYLVETSRGTVRARHVVNATEAYTAKLHPALSGKLMPVQTQLCAATGAPPGLKPNITVSSSTWFGERRGNRIIMGSDETYLPDRLAGQNRPSRFITTFVLAEVQRFAGPFPMEVQNEWSGSVGFSADQFPMVGLMDGHGQYLIGGMCGSGTGVAFNAARCIVNRILGRTGEPDDYPPEFFAPSRLLSPDTHPWPKA